MVFYALVLVPYRVDYIMFWKFHAPCLACNQIHYVSMHMNVARNSKIHRQIYKKFSTFALFWEDLNASQVNCKQFSHLSNGLTSTKSTANCINITELYTILYEDSETSSSALLKYKIESTQI